MQIGYLRDARNVLKRMPANFRDRFMDAFEAIAAGRGAAFAAKRLTGRSEWRLRIGGFRAIYQIENDVLLVMQIGPRGDVDKK